MKITYVVGPYPSRRANDYILIVDTTGFPRKCSYNCIYCPLGSVTVKTVKPEALVNHEAILNDLKEVLNSIGTDFKAILLYGSGEPMLNPWFPLIVNGIRKIVNEYGLASEIWCITTGYLLDKKWVRDALPKIDRLYVKVDSVSKDEFQEINDPCPNISPWKISSVLRDIVKEKITSVCLDTTLLSFDGMTNANPDSMRELCAFASSSRIEDIILKTVNRPPRVRGVKPVSSKIMDRVKKLLEEEGLNVNMLLEPMVKPYAKTVVVNDTLVYNYLLRRPMTAMELSKAFSIPITPLMKILSRLENQGLLLKIPWRNNVFYKAVFKPSSMNVLG